MSPGRLRPARLRTLRAAMSGKGGAARSDGGEQLRGAAAAHRESSPTPGPRAPGCPHSAVGAVHLGAPRTTGSRADPSSSLPTLRCPSTLRIRPRLLQTRPTREAVRVWTSREPECLSEADPPESLRPAPCARPRCQAPTASRVLYCPSAAGLAPSQASRLAPRAESLRSASAPRRLGASGQTRILCPAAPRCRRGGARAGAAA